MEFLNSNKFIVFMVVILLWAGIQGCTPKEYMDKQAPHETTDEMNARITEQMDAMDKEEEQFDQTLDQGMKLLAEHIADLQGTEIPGAVSYTHLTLPTSDLV